MLQRAARSHLAQIVVLAAVYFGLGKLGLTLAFLNQSATLVWPPAGIAVAAVLLLGPRIWPGIALGAFLVNITVTGSILTSASIASGNTLEAVLGGWLVTRLANGRQAFERARDIGVYVLLASVLCTALSATLGVTSLAMGGFVDWGLYARVWLTWWLGDMVSTMIITPAVVLWSTNPFPQLNRRNLLEGLALTVALLLVSLLVFGGLVPAHFDRYPRTFLCMPALLWASFRFGPRGAITAVFALSCVAILGTLSGFGPFVLRSPTESLFLLQAFMATMTLTNLVLGAVVFERRRVREALLESQEQARTRTELLQAVLQFVPAVVWIAHDSDCRVITGNPTSYELLRLPMDTNASKSIPIEQHRLKHFSVLQDGRELPSEKLPVQRAARGEEIRGFEEELRFTDGTSRHLLGNATPLRDARGRPCGAVAAFVDITERKKAEEALRESEIRFRTMANSAPVLIWMSGTDKLRTWFNKPWLDFVGRSLELEVGSGWAENVHPDDFERCLRTYVAAFDDREEFETEYRLKRHDGQWRWVLDHGIPLDRAGEFTGYIGSCVDITARKEAEVELEAWQRKLESTVEQRTSELTRTHQELRAQIQERRRLEADIARAVEREQFRLGHELHDGIGQELAGIGLMMGALQAQLKEVSPACAADLKRLQDTIRETIEHTRILSKGFYPVELERDGLLSALRELASRIDQSPDVHCVLRIDENPSWASLTGPTAIQLFRITQEAVLNAIRHAQARQILIRLASADGHWRLTIQDDGVGLAASQDKAAGMGLRIMAYRAGTIGGALDVSNAPDGGLIVTCSVPVAEGPEQLGSV